MSRIAKVMLSGLLCGACIQAGEQVTTAPSEQPAQVVAPAIEPQTVAPVVTQEAATAPAPANQTAEPPAQTPAQPPAAAPAPAAQSAPAPAGAPASEEAKPAPEEAEIAGIDTVNIAEPEGNWLYKRLWWEKSEARYEKIRERVEQIAHSYEGFLAKRTALDRDLFDKFYNTTGFARGELNDVLNYLIERVEEMRKKKGTLDEKEREFLKLIENEQEELKKLKLEIDAINKIDGKIDDAIKDLTDHLNKCRAWEGQAWTNFKQIAKELSDKTARSLFYGIITFEDNIVAMGNYIEKEFAAYFDKLSQTARDHAAQVDQQLKALAERGVDFKKQAEVLGLRERLTPTAAAQPVETPRTFMGFVLAMPRAIWRLLVTVVDQFKASVYGIIDFAKGLFGEKPAQEQGQQMPPVPPVPSEPVKVPSPLPGEMVPAGAGIAPQK